MQINVMVLQRSGKRIYVFVMVLIDVVSIGLQAWLPIKIRNHLLGNCHTIQNYN